MVPPSLLAIADEVAQQSRAAPSVPSFGRKHGRYWAVKRREFIALIGVLAAWPLAAR
jgi:hypothetical protein